MGQECLIGTQKYQVDMIARRQSSEMTIAVIMLEGAVDEKAEIKSRDERGRVREIVIGENKVNGEVEGYIYFFDAGAPVVELGGFTIVNSGLRMIVANHFLKILGEEERKYEGIIAESVLER